jgi:NADH-quinone oxidoreductase subunit J
MTAAFEVITFAVSAFIAIAGALGMTTTMSMFRSGIFLMASFVGVAGLFILLAADLIGLLQIMMYIGGFLVMILFMVLVMHDPGGAMMAGMDMAFVERWFSKGLVPRESPHGDGDPTGGGHMHGNHADGHDARRHDNEHAGHEHQSMQHTDDGGQKGHVMHHSGEHDEMDMGGMDMSMVTPVRRTAAWLAAAVGVALVSMLLLDPVWRVVDASPDPDSPRRVGHLLMDKYMVAFEGAGFLILIGIFGAVLLARPSTYPDDPSRGGKVAVDKKPEPIADDGLVPLAGPRQPAKSQQPHDSEEHDT